MVGSLPNCLCFNKAKNFLELKVDWGHCSKRGTEFWDFSFKNNRCELLITTKLLALDLRRSREKSWFGRAGNKERKGGGGVGRWIILTSSLAAPEMLVRLFWAGVNILDLKGRVDRSA